MQGTTYELKYCERCGSLGLRRSQSGETYCEPCEQILINYSLAGNLARRSCLRNPKLPVAARLPLHTADSAHSGRRP
jgi:hypothetical protein